MNYFVGTSGYGFDTWCGTEEGEGFYPLGLPKKSQLRYYSMFLNAVEINYTRFAKLKPETCLKWKSEVPSDFHFTLKAPLYITHQKKLNDFERWIDESQFGECISILDSSVLFQFSSSFHCTSKNLEKLNTVIKVCKDVKCAFEFRHPSWYETKDSSLDRLFVNQNMTVVNNWIGGIWESKEYPFPNHENLSFLKRRSFNYYRFHGLYDHAFGLYPKKYLEQASKHIDFRKFNCVYFNNTDSWNVDNCNESFSFAPRYHCQTPQRMPSAILNALFMRKYDYQLDSEGFVQLKFV